MDFMACSSNVLMVSCCVSLSLSSFFVVSVSLCVGIVLWSLLHYGYVLCLTASFFWLIRHISETVPTQKQTKKTNKKHKTKQKHNKKTNRSQMPKPLELRLKRFAVGSPAETPKAIKHGASRGQQRIESVWAAWESDPVILDSPFKSLEKVWKKSQIYDNIWAFWGLIRV